MTRGQWHGSVRRRGQKIGAGGGRQRRTLRLGTFGHLSATTGLRVGTLGRAPAAISLVNIPFVFHYRHHKRHLVCRCASRACTLTLSFLSSILHAHYPCLCPARSRFELPSYLFLSLVSFCRSRSSFRKFNTRHLVELKMILTLNVRRYFCQRFSPPMKFSL